MPWDGVRRRSEDDGRENPEIILARIDERLKSFMMNFDKHVHDDKNQFASINMKIELSNRDAREGSEKASKEVMAASKDIGVDINFLKRSVYIAIGAVAVIQIIVVPIIIQKSVKNTTSIEHGK